MASMRAKYGSLTALGITISSLAAGDARQSAAVSNATTKFIDLELLIAFTLAAGSPGDLSRVNVYLVPSPNGADWPNPAGGADAAIDLTGSPIQGHLVGFIDTPAAGQAYQGYFRGVLDYDNALCLAPHWVLVIENRTGVDFSAGSVKYLGKQIEAA